MTPETWTFLKSLVDAFQAIALAWIVYKTAILTRTMVTLEKNTNSIKDELVKTTSDASHAKGMLDEKVRQQTINTAVEEAKKIVP